MPSYNLSHIFHNYISNTLGGKEGKEGNRGKKLRSLSCNYHARPVAEWVELAVLRFINSLKPL